MRERQSYSTERLHPQLVELISSIEDQTGREVQVQATRAIRDRARAVYVVSDPDPTRHLILYDPKYEAHLDHLVAHECGHIVRFASASPEEQTVAKTTPATRAVAVDGLIPDLRRLLKSGVPEGALADLVPIWLAGTVTQLADTPSDIHIERWIRERMALRGIQETSLLSQVNANAASMRPVVTAFTPNQVWAASNAMNYVSAKAHARMLDRPDLIRPYRRTAIEKLGEELFETFEETADGGLVTDRGVSDRWAERLGLSDWFEWTTLDAVSPDFRHAWQ
jgi:hypothetical protein